MAEGCRIRQAGDGDQGPEASEAERAVVCAVRQRELPPGEGRLARAQGERGHALEDTREIPGLESGGAGLGVAPQEAPRDGPRGRVEEEESPLEGRVQDAGEARPEDQEGAGGRCQVRQGFAGRVPRGHGKEGRGHERLKPDVNDPAPVVREEALFRFHAEARDPA